MRSLLLAIFEDDDGRLYEEAKGGQGFRHKLVRSLNKAASTPRAALRVVEVMGDRLDGRPVQTLKATVDKRTTVFSPAGPTEPAPPAADEPNGDHVPLEPTP
jgi:hypothetical protein